MDEARNIEARYAKRGDDWHLASVVPLHRTLAHQEKERACLRYLRRFPLEQLNTLRALEIGSGFGHNLQQFIRWGLAPENLVGSELLPDRTEIARQVLPAGVTLLSGDSTQLQLPLESFHIVHLSTVLSSILDDRFQQTLANTAWRFLRPGGAILWYDFVVNNPRNPDVRGVPRKRIRQLFPQARIELQSLTLAPPLARMVTRWAPPLYPIFNFTPLLRTHVLGWLTKPTRGDAT